MDQPLVSVCIPAYNAEKTLPTTLESLLRQRYPNIEIIVSDNRSNDRTLDVIKGYANQGVQYCIHPERPAWASTMPAYVGAYMNANFVLSRGKGEYLCLYHADDVYEPDIIEKQVAFMQTHPKVGAAFTMMRPIGHA